MSYWNLLLKLRYGPRFLRNKQRPGRSKQSTVGFSDFLSLCCFCRDFRLGGRLLWSSEGDGVEIPLYQVSQKITGAFGLGWNDICCGTALAVPRATCTGLEHPHCAWYILTVWGALGAFSSGLHKIIQFSFTLEMLAWKMEWFGFPAEGECWASQSRSLSCGKWLYLGQEGKDRNLWTRGRKSSYT